MGDGLSAAVSDGEVMQDCLLTMDALYAERDLCQAIVSHGRDYLVRIKGNQPEVLEAMAEGTGSNSTN